MALPSVFAGMSKRAVVRPKRRQLVRGLGFREVGLHEKHGQLAGQWVDVVVAERLITENLKSE